MIISKYTIYELQEDPCDRLHLITAASESNLSKASAMPHTPIALMIPEFLFSTIINVNYIISEKNNVKI